MKIEDIPGFMDGSELTAIQSLASTLPDNEVWIEVGSWGGKSLLSTGLGLSEKCSLFSVENYAGISKDIPFTIEAKESLKNVTKYLNSILKSTILIEEDSIKASSYFLDKTLHAVFIDGGHGYHEVYNDILHWLPKIKKGGFICGHDYNLAEVRIAVDDHFPKVKVLHDTTIWLVNQ